MRKKITVRGVEEEAWEASQAIRSAERRQVGAVLSDALLAYWDEHYAEEDDLPSAA